MPRRAPWLALSLGLTACATRPVAPLAPPLAPGLVTVADGVPIGTAHPFKIFDADPHARWLGLCQAREDTDGDGKIATGDGYPTMAGDRMRPYLVFGPGPGVEIDDYIGPDRAGDSLIFIKDGRLLIHHTSEGRTEALTHADTTDDADTVEFRHRAATLDTERRRLAYHVLRDRGRRSDLVIRDLQTHRDVVIPLPGLLHRAIFNDDGAWLLLTVVTVDSDGDGHLDLSTSDPMPGPRACHGTYPMHHGSPDPRGDNLEQYAAATTGGPPHAIPDLIFPVGDLLLIRQPDASLIALHTDGHTEQWVPADCEGHILAHSAATRRALVVCNRWPNAPSLEIHGPGFHRLLQTTPNLSAHHDTSWDDRRFVHVEAAAGTYIIDLVTLNEWRVPHDQRLFHINDRGAILTSGGADPQYQQWDLLTGTLTPTSNPFLAVHSPWNPHVFATSGPRELRQVHPPPPPKPTPPRDPNAGPDLTTVLPSAELTFFRGPRPIGPLMWVTPRP